MHSYLNEFLLIAISHFLAVASPGPDFAFVLKQSVSYGKKQALWASAGIGLGIFIHVAYCLLGFAVVLSRSPELLTLFKWLAAAYLLYIGVQAIQAKAHTEHESSSQGELQQDTSSWRSFSQGFLVNALNPKATLFFLSLFTVVISIDTPLFIQGFYGVYMALATFVWFAFLSIYLSKSTVRAFFQRAGHWFDRAIGGCMILLAVGIIF